MEFREITVEELEKLQFDCDNFLQSAEMYRRYQKIGREAYLIGVCASQVGRTSQVGQAAGQAGQIGQARQAGQDEQTGRADQANQPKQIIAAGLLTARNWRLGKKIFRVAGGWLMDYGAENYTEVLQFLTSAAKKFVQTKGGIAIEITPYVESRSRDMNNKIIEGVNNLSVRNNLEKLGYKYLGEYEQAKWEFVLDLAGQTPEKLLSEFRTTHRQLIRKAEREGVRVRELKADELGILKKIAAESGERHGFKDPELEYYQTMKEAFGDKVEFLVAENAEHTPVAAAMFVKSRTEITYLYSGSVRELQKYNGVYAIQWYVINQALKGGYQRYNFYGTHPIEGDGVYLFKQGFRGRVLELLGAFILPIGVIGKIYAWRLKPQEFREIA